MRLESLTEVYSQDEDSDGRVNIDVQEIEISVVDAGGGPYVVIKTERWAVGDGNEVDAFAAKLKEILARMPEE